MKNIEWNRVGRTTHDVTIREVPDKLSRSGKVSFFVATDREGQEFLPCWDGRNAFKAQDHLNRLARFTERKKARERKAKG